MFSLLIFHYISHASSRQVIVAWKYNSFIISEKHEITYYTNQRTNQVYHAQIHKTRSSRQYRVGLPVNTLKKEYFAGPIRQHSSNISLFLVSGEKKLFRAFLGRKSCVSLRSTISAIIKRLGISTDDFRGIEIRDRVYSGRKLLHSLRISARSRIGNCRGAVFRYWCNT